MIVDTGFSVTVRTWFRIASPLPGSLVSTSTTPPWVTNTVVFPPAPGITYRLSRTFLIAPVGGIRGRCCCAATPATARPTTTIAGRRLLHVISGPRREEVYGASETIRRQFQCPGGIR